MTTEDGYILEMFRIEHGKTDNFEAADKKVVLLQHALLNSAHNYIANTEERALAFVFANNGYDVVLCARKPEKLAALKAHIQVTLQFFISHIISL